MITSIIISVLLVILVGVVLLFILLDPIDNVTPEIVSYQAREDKTEKIKERTFTRAVERKPSSPSSSMAKVIAANTVSAIAIPVPEINVPDPSTQFGDGDDFGDGWGDGFGGGAGVSSFFGQPIHGKRILYVIDYSESMQGARQRLMRAELAESIYKLSPDIKFQMIFFAGPAWVAGDQVNMNGKKSAKIVAGQASYLWKSSGKAHQWDPEGDLRKPGWLKASDTQVEKSKKIIRGHRLIWGTNWKNPLEMAFQMDPLPETIIFMTDGVAAGDPIGVAKAIARKAKKNKITINTVALMEPKAAEAMAKLAEGSGGKFVLIGADGKKRKGQGK